MLAGLSHKCRGGYAGKPKQCLGGAGRCLGLVFVIPAANLEWDSPSSVGSVTQSRTETFLCRWTLQVCNGSSGRRRGKMLQAKNRTPHGAERKEKKLSHECWETLTAPTTGQSCPVWQDLVHSFLVQLVQTLLGKPLFLPPILSYSTGVFFELDDAHVSVSLQTKGDPPLLPSGLGSGISLGCPGSASQLLHPFPLHFLLLFPERKVNFWECQNSVNADI